MRTKEHSFRSFILYLLYLLYCHINYYLHNIVSGQLVLLLLKIDDESGRNRIRVRLLVGTTEKDL